MTTRPARNQSPKLWGLPWWIFLHLLPRHAENTFQGRVAREFLLFLVDLIPCASCAGHYEEYTRQHPLSHYWIRTPTRLAIWLNNLHNDIDRRTNHPVMNWKMHRNWSSKIQRNHELWLSSLFTVCYSIFAHIPEHVNQDTTAIRKSYTHFIHYLVLFLHDTFPMVATRFQKAFIDQDPEACDLHRKSSVVVPHDVWHQVDCLQTTLHRIEKEILGTRLSLVKRLEALSISPVTTVESP